jgi:hypothetical protein
MLRATPTKGQVVPREPRMRDTAVVVGRGAGKEEKGRGPW